jgi:hypothetical protein
LVGGLATVGRFIAALGTAECHGFPIITSCNDRNIIGLLRTCAAPNKGTCVIFGHHRKRRCRCQCRLWFRRRTGGDFKRAAVICEVASTSNIFALDGWKWRLWCFLEDNDGTCSRCSVLRGYGFCATAGLCVAPSPVAERSSKPFTMRRLRFHEAVWP